MENQIGRCLKKNECIHHINNIREDDRLENLQLVTRGEHNIIHNLPQKMREKRWPTNVERKSLNPEYRKAKKREYSLKHKLKLKQYIKKYYKINKERLLERKRKYYKENREKILLQKKEAYNRRKEEKVLGEKDKEK
jgi:hypothetical protein